MASLARGKRLVKNMTPELVSKALAEWILVDSGFDVNAAASVTMRMNLTPDMRTVKNYKVEIEIL